MMRHTSHMGSMVLGVFLLAAPLCAEEQPVLKTRTDKDSYMTGIDIVQGLKKRGGQIDLDIVIRGMKDGLTGENMLMSEDDIRKYLAARDREGTVKQKQDENQLEDMQSKTASTAPNSEPAVQQKQDRPELQRQNEQGEAFLAHAPAGATASTVNAGRTGATGDPGNVQQQRNEQVDQPAQSGPVLSRRNQAKLNVAEMKRARAAAFSGNTGQ